MSELEGRLWSLFRNVLTQGHAQQEDYRAGKFNKDGGYEAFCIHFEEAATKRVQEALALIAASPPQPPVGQGAQAVNGWVYIDEEGKQVGYHDGPICPDKRPAWRPFFYSQPPQSEALLREALSKLVYEDKGRYFVGIIGDADVTDIVGAALAGGPRCNNGHPRDAAMLAYEMGHSVDAYLAGRKG